MFWQASLSFSRISFWIYENQNTNFSSMFREFSIFLYMSMHSEILVVASTMLNELFCNAMRRSFTGANISEQRATFMITEDETSFRQTPLRVLFSFVVAPLIRFSKYKTKILNLSQNLCKAFKQWEIYVVP